MTASSAGTRRGTATSRAVGYGGVANEGLRFFPLFAVLGRVVSWLPGASAGFGIVFVANASALALGFALHALVMQERDDRALARRAVWLVYLAPPAFVLVMGYAEATFMTLAALTLIGLRARRWWVAAIFGLLAGITRPVGVLLSVPAAVEGWQQRDAKAVVPAVAPVAGLLAYLAWAAHRAHDFWYPIRAQSDPTRRGKWVDPVRAVAHNVHELFVGDHVSAGMHAVSALVFVALLVVIARRWPLVVHAVRGGCARRRAQQPQPRLARALRALGAAVRARRRRRDRGPRNRTRRAVPRRCRPRRRLRPGVHRRRGALNRGRREPGSGSLGHYARPVMSSPDAPPSAAGPEVKPELSVVVIGAGPAGLTAAYELTKAGHASAVTILEADDVVGGISRTVLRDGWRFDIGGHRFFTKVRAVDDLWWEILGQENFLSRPRQSRIFYRGKLYDYPLVTMNVLRNLGPIEALRCVASYVWVRIHPPKNRDTLEGFIAARFGWRLYQHFFKAYNEKVWGVPASELSADWGAQRIKDLSLFRAMKDALTPKRFAKRDKSKMVTSLIDEFNYPKFGPGMMWEVAADKVVAAGANLEFDRRVTGIHHGEGGATAVVAVDRAGVEHVYPCTHVVSSMPIGALCAAMQPPVDATTGAAAADLRYRDHLTVALVVPQKYSFTDNWVYIHDPEVQVGRVQNYGSWSPFMVKDGRTCLGLEYFVNEGDAMWTKSDADLIEQGRREMHTLGLIDDPSQVEAAYVVRMAKAYPVYDEMYQDNVETMRKWLAANTPNVFPCGRNGMHRYNNQDHSMLTAMLSVENILTGTEHDVWSVNVEAEYHEEQTGDAGGGGATGRDAPFLPRSP